MRFAVILRVTRTNFAGLHIKKSVPKASGRGASWPVDIISAQGTWLDCSRWLLLVLAQSSHAAAFSCFLLPPCISWVIILFRRRRLRNLSRRWFGRIGSRVLTCSVPLSGPGNRAVIRSRLLIIGLLVSRLLIIGSLVSRLLVIGSLIGRLLVGRLLINRLLIGRLHYRPGERPVVYRLAGRRVLRRLVDRPACRLCKWPVRCISCRLYRLEGRLTSGLPIDGLLTNRLPIDRPLADRLLIRRLLNNRLLISGPLIGRLLIDRLLVNRLLIRRLLIDRLCYRSVERPVVHRLVIHRLAGGGIVIPIPIVIIPVVIAVTTIIPTIVIVKVTTIISPAIIPIPIVDSCIDGPGIIEGLHPGRSYTRSSIAISPVALRSAIDPWTVNSQGPIVILLAGSVTLPDDSRSYRSTRIPSYFLRIRAAAIVDIPGTAIAPVIDDGGIVDNSSVMDNRHIPRLIHIIITDLGTADILMRHKAPILRRGIVATPKRNVHADIRSQRRPAIIILAASPAHPGRGPFRSGHPHPPIAVLEKPAAVVESSPAPGIIGSPGPAIFGVDPVAIGSIGLKIRTGIR